MAYISSHSCDGPGAPLLLPADEATTISAAADVTWHNVEAGSSDKSEGMSAPRCTAESACAPS